MANLVVHFEIHASEPQKLVDVYSGLLGWTFDRYGEAPYWVINTGEGAIGNVAGTAGHGINGGLVERQGPKPDVGASVNGCNIVIGGKEALPPQDWPGVGRVGDLLDPDNNVFGLISPIMSDGTVGMGGADS
jgi:predicted enzyme related to lactoylglutathione lyase